MPRSYGITNAAPYASAPPVGADGDTYWNTTNKTLYVSDGTAWNPWPGGGGVSYGGVTQWSGGFNQSKADGVAASASRSDHFHGVPPLSGAVPNPLVYGGSGSAGTINTLASASDHVHPLPALANQNQVQAWVSTASTNLTASQWNTVTGWALDTTNYPSTAFFYTGSLTGGVCNFTVAGLFLINGQVATNPGATSLTRQVRIVGGGGLELGRNTIPPATGLAVSSLTAIMQANVGDNLYWAVYGAAGGLSLDSSVGHRWQIVRIA